MLCMPMRILYLTDSASVHGAEANLLDLLANLDRAQVEPFVAVAAAGRVTFQLVGSGIRFVLLPFPPPAPRGFTMKHWFQAARSAASLADYVRQNRIDLVHSITTAAHLVGGMAARKAGVPAIWHARRLRPLNRLRSLLEGTAARIIAPWPCVADALVAQGIGEERIVRLNDGIDFKSVLPHTGYTLPERAALPKRTFVFGMVGNESATSGHAVFFEAARRAAGESRFWSIGSTVSGVDARPAELLGERDDLGDFYHAVNCVVIPSLDEQSGRVAIEAACAGRPIIATNVGAHAELFADGGALLIPADHAQALARALRHVMTNANLRRELGAAARRRIGGAFAVRFASEKLTDLYRSLITDHCSPLTAH